MSTKVEKTVLLNVPLSIAYDQWTQFEDFPRFMGGVKSVTQLGDDRLQWVAEIAGVRRQWEAQILEQVPDRRVSWAATEGATNAGTVEFEDAGPDQTSVYLVLEYEPEGWVEKVGDALNAVGNQAERDLERFKEFIEAPGHATGAWRGTVHEGAGVAVPGIEDAVESRGDAGKAGVSGKVVAVGVGAAAATGAAVVAAKNKDADKEPATGTSPTSDQASLSPDAPLGAKEQRGAATEPEASTEAQLDAENTTGDGMGTTPVGAPTSYDLAPTAEQPVPPAGSIEDLIPPAGAPRIGADSDIPEQSLGADVPLDGVPMSDLEIPVSEEETDPAGTPAKSPLGDSPGEEPVLPLEDTPPMVAPDVAPVDVTPPEGSRTGVDPVIGQPVDEDCPTRGTN